MRNFIRNDFPCDLGIDSAVAMRDNISHSLNLTPRHSWMLFTEFICQFSHQFTDLQNTECGCISVNGVVPKCLGVVAEAVNGLLICWQ